MTLKFSILRNLEEFRRKFKVGKPISFTITKIVFTLDQTGIKFSSRISYRALANHVENVICLKKENSHASSCSELGNYENNLVQEIP